MASRIQADEHLALQSLPPAAAADSQGVPSQPSVSSLSTIPPGTAFQNGPAVEASDGLKTPSSLFRSLRDRLRSSRKAERVRREPLIRGLDAFEHGYPNLATFIDSSPSFMLFRRFGYLQARCLLERQDKLRELEEELDRRDDAARHEHENFSRTQYTDSRRLLLKEIQQEFIEYSDLLTAAHRMLSFAKPAKIEYESVNNYMNDHEPVVLSEQSYVRHIKDLISVRATKGPLLDYWIERLLGTMGRIFPLLPRLFADPSNSSADYIMYFDDQRIRNLSWFISTSTVLAAIQALLIVPIYLLYRQVSGSDGHLSSHVLSVCLGILVSFTIAFSSFMMLFTAARRHEILAAAAAYLAVLVVFLGNVN